MCMMISKGRCDMFWNTTFFSILYYKNYLENIGVIKTLLNLIVWYYLCEFKTTFLKMILFVSFIRSNIRKLENNLKYIYI